MTQRSLAKRLWYKFLHVTCRLGFVTLCRIRCHHRERLPKARGVLVLSNHQSHLDPVIVGLACDRRLNYLARDTLFGFAPFRWLIQSLDAIPIDREGSGLGGLKETLKRLRNDELVLVFPEGTRTRDGSVARLKPGFSALAQRAGVPLQPIAIAGAFEAWPRSRKLPRPAIIHVAFGEPITPAQIASWSERELVAAVQARIEACFEEACSRRAHSSPRPKLLAQR